MQREVFVVEKERFDLSDEKIYHLQGTWPKEHTAAAELDGKSLEVNLKQQERISARNDFRIWIWWMRSVFRWRLYFQISWNSIKS